MRVSIFALCAGLTPQAVCAEPLEELVARAVSRHPALAAARARNEGTESQTAIARAQGRPNITASVDYSEPIYGPVDTQRALVAQSRLQIPLYQGGRVRNSVLASEARSLATSYQLTSTELSVAYDTIAAYIRLADRNQRLAILQDSISGLSELRAGVARRVQLRDLTQTDLDQTDGRLATAQLGVIQASANLEQAQAELANLVGDYSSSAQWPNLTTASVMSSTTEAIVAAQTTDNELRGITAAIEAARYDVRAIEGEGKPQLAANLRTAYTDQFTDLGGVGANGRFVGSAGISMSMNLYQGGRQSARVRQAITRVTELEQQLRERSNAVETAVRIARSDLAAAIESLETARQADAAAKSALANVRREFQLGNRTLIDLLNADQEAQNASIQQIAATSAKLIATLAYVRLFSGNANDLLLAVTDHPPGALSPEVEAAPASSQPARVVSAPSAIEAASSPPSPSPVYEAPVDISFAPAPPQDFEYVALQSDMTQATTPGPSAPAATEAVVPTVPVLRAPPPAAEPQSSERVGSQWAIQLGTFRMAQAGERLQQLLRRHPGIIDLSVHSLSTDRVTLATGQARRIFATGYQSEAEARLTCRQLTGIADCLPVRIGSLPPLSPLP